MIRQVSVEYIAQALELLSKIKVEGSDAPMLTKVFHLLGEVMQLNSDSPAPSEAKSEEVVPL